MGRNSNLKIEFYHQKISLDPEQEPDHIIILISLAKLTVGPIHVLLYNYHVKYVLGISQMSSNTQQIKNIPCQYKIIGLQVEIIILVHSGMALQSLFRLLVYPRRRGLVISMLMMVVLE